MAHSKKTQFDEQQQYLADCTKALSHPARIAILQVLAERKSCVCGEIVDLLPLSQATVSQHLKVLKEAGFILGEIEGPRSCYCLSEKGLQRFQKGITLLMEALKKPFSCC